MWLKWTIIIIYWANLAWVIAKQGQPRREYDGGDIIWGFIIAVLLTWGLNYYWK